MKKIQDVCSHLIRFIQACFDRKLIELSMPIRGLFHLSAARLSFDGLVDHLIMLKLMAFHLAAYRTTVNASIDSILSLCRKSSGGSKKIAMLGVELDKRSSEESEAATVARMLIAEHSAFEGYYLAIRNQKTLTFTVEKVLKGIEFEGDSLDKRSLEHSFTKFDEMYWKIVQSGLGKDKTKQDKYRASIVIEVKERARSRMQAFDKVIFLMANIFAHWTLSNARHYMEAREQDDIGITSNSKQGTLDSLHA